MSSSSLFAGLNWADMAILALIAISAMLSLRRGFVREALSLATWLVSIWIALSFSQAIAAHMPDAVQTPSLRIALAFLILPITSLVIGNLLMRMVVGLVQWSGLSSTDRLLGSLFGVVRGVLIVGVAVLLLAMTPVSSDPWWKASRLIDGIHPAAQRIVAMLPDEMREIFARVDTQATQMLKSRLGGKMPATDPVEADQR